MRLPVFISVALVWSLAAPAVAQEWVEFVSREDGFKIVFPGQPRVQQSTYTSQQGYTLPSRIHSAENGQQRFSVPSGYPEPGFFQQTMGFVDRNGNGIRYQTIYSNAYHGLGEYPVPPLTGGGRGVGAGAAGAGAAAAGTVGAAQAAPAPPAQPAPGPRFIATYVEVAPASEAQALALLRAYRDASRREEGNVKADILQQNGRRGHFAILEEWRDESAWKNHRGSARVAQFHEKLTPLRVTSYDERTHTVFAVGSSTPASGDAVMVVTHVDVVPNGLPKAREFLSAQVEASRKEAGNLRFDVLQGVRMNHFTVVEVWTNERAREAHVSASHTRTYREGLRETAVDGAPYDERLYRLVP